jgi:hypothetical protein
MANQTCMFPVFYIQGDGASLAAQISLKATPLLFDRFTVVNFPKDVDTVTLLSATDSLSNSVSSQVSVASSGSLVTLTFSTAFTDIRTIKLIFQFNV